MPVPRVAPTLPVEPAEYHHFWRAPGIQPWRPIVVTLLSALAFLALSVVIPGLAVVLEVAAGTIGADEVEDLLYDGRVSPGLVLGNSVAIGLTLVAVLLLARLVKQPPRFLHSVLGRFRWKWFLACAGASLVILAAHTGIDILRNGIDTLDLQIRPYTWWLLVGLMLATPFQAATEEYLFRGVLFRTVASWFRTPLVALIAGGVLNSAVFTAIHGATDPWLNLFYFVLGCLLSYITWRTGGLEAAAAVHIVNNMIGFGFVAFQDVTTLFDRSEGTGGPFVLVQMLAMIVLVAVIEVMARRGRIQRVGPPR